MTTSPSDAPRGPGAPDVQPSGRSKVIKAVLSTALTLAVLVVVFGVIFPGFADYEDAWAAIRGMSGAALMILLGAVALNLAVYAWPYVATLPSLRFRDAFSVRQTGFMMSNGIPGIGGALGMGLQYQMLATYGVQAAPSASAIGITSTWNLLITLALPVLGVVALLVTGQLTSQAFAAALVGAVVVVAAVVVLALVLRSESGARRVGELAESVANPVVVRFRKGAPLDLVDPVLHFRLSIVDIVAVRWASITWSNLAMQVTSWLVLFVALRSIEADLPEQVGAAECFAAFAFARLGGFIPITPGGLGTVDLLLTTFLTAFGASNEDALAATLVWRAGTFFPQMFVGMCTFLLWRVRSRRRADAPGGPG